MNGFAFLMLAAAAPLTLGEVESLGPAGLAPRLLPADIAAKIRKARGRQQFVPGQVYWVGFWEAAKPVGRTVCAAMLHSVRVGAASDTADRNARMDLLSSESGTSYGTTYPRLATDESCASVEYPVGSGPGMADATIAVLDRLAEAMDAASAPAPLPFALECADVHDGHACADPRRALASLPVDALLGVDLDRSPQGPTVRFGMSGPDGNSWHVTLGGAPGAVTRVAMQRLSIVYH